MKSGTFTTSALSAVMLMSAALPVSAAEIRPVKTYNYAHYANVVIECDEPISADRFTIYKKSKNGKFYSRDEGLMPIHTKEGLYSINISGLSPAKKHTFKFSAQTEDGERIWSEPFFFYTAPLRTRLRSAIAGKTSVRLEWEPMDNVLFKVQQHNGSKWETIHTTSFTDAKKTRSKNAYLVKRLDRHTAYHFRVLAVRKGKGTCPAVSYTGRTYLGAVFGRPSKPIEITTK